MADRSEAFAGLRRSLLCSIIIDRQIVFVLAFMGACGTLATDKELIAMQTQRDVHDPDYYLAKMGPKFGIHFTIEYLVGSDTFLRTEQPLDLTVNTLDELTEELEKKINAKVILDRQDENHPVIHLIDKTLGKKSEILDRKIGLRYSGIVGNLGAELEKQGVPGIERHSWASYPAEAFDDYVTEVDIDVQQEPVRDILTHSVDLDEYRPLIWLAKTYQTDKGEWKTQIRFTGPKPVGRAAP